MQTNTHPNGSFRANAAHPAPAAARPALERLHAVECDILDALAIAREALARCEQALTLLFEIRADATLAPVARCDACATGAAPAAHDMPRAPRHSDQPNGLTAREAEILQLIAAGKSNREIAEALFLSPRTIERHIANLYPKIGTHNKAEATAWALRHALG